MIREAPPAYAVVDLRLEGIDPSTGVGELLIRGANVVRGYWDKPEATAQAFTDGWLHSGDLARIDEAAGRYAAEVRARSFPSAEQIYAPKD